MVTAFARIKHQNILKDKKQLDLELKSTI